MVVKTSTSLAYGACQFGASAMQSLFITYYVVLYLDVYKLDAAWFFAGEALFLVWNALNDPLFGFWLRGESISRRLAALNGGGSLWVLSFAAFFLVPPQTAPWLVGVHFVAALLLYDTFLSYVILVHASLLADISSDPDQRASCNAWASACSVLGALTVFGANMLWDAGDMVSFRVFCLCCALLSLGSMQLSFVLLSKRHGGDDGGAATAAAASVAAASKGGDGLDLWAFWSELRGHTNFWAFAGVNLVQVFNCHFNSNFLAGSLDRLLVAWGRPRQSGLLAAAALLPHVVVIAVAPLLRRLGAPRLLQLLAVLKIAISLTAFVFLLPAQSAPVWVAVFFLANKVFTETMCRHGNLVVADLIDEDSQLHPLRVQSRSSLYFGAIALFTKPGQAMAAMVGWGAFATGSGAEGQLQVFRYATLVPAACGALQLVCWRFFKAGDGKEMLKVV